MQLDQIERDYLERAIGIYLQYAYTLGPLPERVRSLCKWDCNEHNSSLWEDERFEVVTGEQSKHFFLRLGNELYPHMKLGIVECSGRAKEYVFVADTHDQHFEVDQRAPDYELFRSIQVKNELLKQKIEEAWLRAGIATPKSLEALIPKSLTIDPISTSAKTILIVDDTPATLQLMRSIFQKRGFNVVESADGHAALAAVDSYSIDLCVLDIMMPDMDGYEVVQMMELAGKRTFPILFSSAMMSHKVKAGIADDLISKPFSPTLLIEKVNRLLETEPRHL